MGKTLYLDCTNGISGDMTVAALLDLGANEARLRDALASLPVAGYEVRVSRVAKAGIDCCDFDVVLDAEHENHDHDMAYLHGEGAALAEPAPDASADADACHDGDYHGHLHHHHAHGEGCGHGHSEGCCHAHEHDSHGHHHGHGHDCDHAHVHHHSCGHAHDHPHDHDHHHAHGHHHEHRGPADIDRIIDAGQLAPRARELAHRMVDVIAHAEAKAHAVPLEEVHFHEVGAIDSIVDIVAVAVCLDDLDVTRVIVPRLVDGRGTIRCQHGIIPVPVPATLNIVEAHGLPLSICDVEGELVTPTGAAIVAATRAEHRLPERFRVVRTGLGAGKRAYERPSILRAMVIEELDDTANASMEARPAAGSAPARAGAPDARPTLDTALPGPVVRLECDIDDATGEQLAYAAERLRAAGAREVHWVPIFTKKERPAWQLQVVAAPADAVAVERVIFAETTTIGVRRWTCERTVLPREELELATMWGTVRAKRATLPDGSARVKPEFADCARIACEQGVPLRAVQEAALAAAAKEGR